jgi:hypothetical protein
VREYPNSYHSYKQVALLSVPWNRARSTSDGKVRFSSVQRLFCPNPEPEHWFGSAISLNPELNPWFRFKGFSSGSGRVWTLN